MPTLPWTSPRDATAAAAPSAPAIAMTSRFLLTSRRHTARMLRTALRVRGAALAAPGLVGMSLVASPLRGEYWTLSVWADRGALDGFVVTPVHRAAMRDIRTFMRGADFAFWDVDAAGPPPSWEQARARLRQETDGRTS